MLGKFETGRILTTCGVNQKVAEDKKFAEFCIKSFGRHINGDWGDLCDEDKAMNDSALAHGDDRIFSKYDYDENTSIYIITEWDRSATTFLFPDEY